MKIIHKNNKIVYFTPQKITRLYNINLSVFISCYITHIIEQMFF